MGEAIDLGKMFDIAGISAGAPMKPVDTSGLPSPTRAIAVLSSGIQVDCDVQYAGLMPDQPNVRRFRVVAELDWATCNVVSISLDRWPPGIAVTLRVPEHVPDERCIEIGRGIHWTVAGEQYSPGRMEFGQ
jgi:hypothetical protein